MADVGRGMCQSRRRLKAGTEAVKQCAWQARLLLSPAHKPCMKNMSLCRLARLDASYNSLEGLPEGIGGMTSLVELVLGNNSIGRLPPAVSGLQALKTLDLRVNRCAHCSKNTSRHVLRGRLMARPAGIEGCSTLGALLQGSQRTSHSSPA